MRPGCTQGTPLRSRAETARAESSRALPRAKSRGLTLYQSFTQPALAAQPPLDSRHPALILLVIVAKQVEQTMQCKHTQLRLQRMPGIARLSAGHSGGDDHIPQLSRLAGWKRKYIGRAIFAAVSSIEGAHTRIGNDGDRHGPTRACRNDGLKPAPQPGRPHARRRHDLD